MESPLCALNEGSLPDVVQDGVSILVPLVDETRKLPLHQSLNALLLSERKPGIVSRHLQKT